MGQCVGLTRLHCAHSGIIFGGIQGVFSLDPNSERGRFRSEANRFALYCFIVSLVATLGVVLQAYFSTRMSEILSRKMRLQTFSSTLRQDVSRIVILSEQKH